MRKPFRVEAELFCDDQLVDGLQNILSHCVSVWAIASHKFQIYT